MINYPISVSRAIFPRQRCTHTKLYGRREIRVFSATAARYTLLTWRTQISQLSNLVEI